MRRRTIALITALVTLHLALLFAGFIAPYDSATQSRRMPYAPPTHLHFHDATGWHLRPFVCSMTFGPDGYVEDKGETFPLRFLVRGSSYKLLGMLSTDMHLFGVDSPGHIALFGTDGFGRDEFSRALLGGQISVAAGIAATLIALSAGTLFGVLAGFYGRC